MPDSSIAALQLSALHCNALQYQNYTKIQITAQSTINPSFKNPPRYARGWPKERPSLTEDCLSTGNPYVIGGWNYHQSKPGAAYRCYASHVQPFAPLTGTSHFRAKILAVIRDITASLPLSGF